MVKIPMDRIIPDPNNENVHTEQDVTKLANLIKAAGRLLQPIMVRSVVGKDLYQIVFGEGRWLAHKQLGWNTIEAEIVRASDEEVVLMRAAENCGRRFDVIGECLSLANLYSSGQESEELARIFGQPLSTIGHKIAIGYFPPELIERLRANSIWQMGYLSRLLGLRRTVDRGVFQASITDPDNIDYSEVERAISLVESGKIASDAELREYVPQRRLELQAEAVEQEVQARLEEREADIEAQYADRLQEEIEQQMAGIQTEQSAEISRLRQLLDEAIESARRSRNEFAKIAAEQEQQPAIGAIQDEYEARLAEALERVNKRDERIGELLVEIERVKQSTQEQASEIAQTEIDSRLAEIRGQLDEEHAQKLEALQRHYKELEKSLQAKAEARIDRLINTIRGQSAELMNLLGVLVFDQYKLLDWDQQNDLMDEIDRLINALSQAKRQLEIMSSGRPPSDGVIIEGRYEDG